jgi:hypothetical protein
MPAFDDQISEIEPLGGALRELEGLADGFGRALTTAFWRAAVEGKALDDVLRSLALMLAGRALSAALAPIGQRIGGIVGGVLGGGRATATGGSAMRVGLGDLGRVGSRGAEAAGAGSVSPERRAGAAGIQVTFNVTSPDAQSFRRAEAELTAMLARTVARGQRGL